MHLKGGTYLENLINSNLLKSQMVLRGVTPQKLASALSWSLSTARRKINGKSDFTALEIYKCAEFLELTTEISNEIFFTKKVT